MKLLQIHHRLAWILGALLAFPTAYLITASLLKYGMGIPGMFDSIEKPLMNLGGREPLGWNINLLILFGPLLALLLNFGSVISIKFNNDQDWINISLSVRKRGPNLVIAIISAALLLILFFYMVGENCR